MAFTKFRNTACIPPPNPPRARSETPQRHRVTTPNCSSPLQRRGFAPQLQTKILVFEECSLFWDRNCCAFAANRLRQRLNVRHSEPGFAGEESLRLVIPRGARNPSSSQRKGMTTKRFFREPQLRASVSPWPTYLFFYLRYAIRPATIVAIGAPRKLRPSKGELRDLLADSRARNVQL